MRLIALAIALLAASILIHPFTLKFVEARENTPIAASCWEQGATNNVSDIVREHLTKQIMAYILGEKPDTKISATDIGKTLLVVVTMPSVDHIDPLAKGADCSARIHVQYRSGEAENIVQYSVRPAADGSLISLRTTAIDQLFQELNKSLARLK